jgi:hypothetical protein
MEKEGEGKTRKAEVGTESAVDCRGICTAIVELTPLLLAHSFSNTQARTRSTVEPAFWSIFNEFEVHYKNSNY